MATHIPHSPTRCSSDLNDFLRSEQFAAFDTRSPSEVIAVIQPNNANPSATQYAWDAVNGSGAPFSGPAFGLNGATNNWRSEEHTSELQSRENLVCRLLL